MDGVTILNTYMGWTTLDTVFLLLWGFVIIGITLIFMIYGFAYDYSLKMLILLGVVGACAFVVVLHCYPKTEHIQATIDQSVSWTELTERYEIIRVDGKIITMIEREKDDGETN